jgi:soluble lytic murein transglycosylase-like protein
MKQQRAKDAWRGGKDFRIVCPCQAHARCERAWWRRGLRALKNTSVAAKSGLALLVGLPLVLGVNWMPMETLSRYRAVSRKAAPVVREVREAASRPFPVFTTDRVRRDFLNPQSDPQTLTLEISKEAFFRAHVPYGSIIYREAKRNNLSPELVAAVVESESDFRAGLQSNRNAQGLMQIVPETGRLMGAENLFNPEQNIAAGTKYLRYLFDRFGDERTVLAAYNAGEGNIERFGGVPPFNETQTYVERVARRTKQYSARVHRTFVAENRTMPAER